VNQLTHKAGTGVTITQSALLDNIPLENTDMSAGVAVSFPMLGIRGGKWHYRWKGDDRIIKDDQNQFALPAIPVVILKSQKELSRTFYPQGSYVEQGHNRPVCWSSDGVKPDDGVPEPISPICATCPNSAWGSGATAAAPRAQACQQRRRVVVTPYGDDLTNADQGGPVLLSVPPSSLRNQDEYAKLLTDNGAQYFGCVTQLSFDQSTAFPRIQFAWVAPLSDEEVTTVMELREHEQVARILNSKINIDGPEADDDAPVTSTPMGAGTPSQGAAPPTRATERVRPAPQPSVQPTTLQAAKLNLGAIKMAPAAPVATAPAPQPKKIGGFAINPRKQEASISEAVAKPAAPPPSTRTVRTPPVAEPTAGEAVREDQAHGSLPDELTSRFGDLMGG
jgi:hypothetical protein